MRAGVTPPPGYSGRSVPAQPQHYEMSRNML
jgi:hypothetical protein